MALLIRESEVAELLSMSDALALVEEAFGRTGRERPVNQPRRRVGSGKGTLNVMSSALPTSDVFGLKAYPVSPGGVNFTILLYSASTSDLLAILEAGRLGQLRTGAASGVATKYLARRGASTHGLFGAGHQAETQLEAVAGAVPLERVLVHSRRQDRLREFCARMAGRVEFPVEPAGSPEALLECDIVTTATSSTQPVFNGSWLRPGTHVNVVGSNFASKAEVDLETVRKSSLVVVDSLDSGRIEGGDLLPAIDRGILSWEHVFELGDVVGGIREGRRGADDITLFKSHGVASEDIALAHKAYTRATERGLGQRISMSFGE